MNGKKSSPIGKIMKYGVPLVISVGLCYLLFTGIDFRAMLTIIRDQCNWWWIGGALVLAVVSHVIRALRWGIQLRALGVDAPTSALIYSIFGTYAVNLVFPRLGEVWRTGYIAQRQHAPFTTVFGSMVADRLADTITVLLITIGTFALASGAILTYMKESGASFQAVAGVLESPWLWGAAILVIAFVWWFMRLKSENSKIVKIQTAVRELWQGFAVIATMPHKGRWLLLTVALWSCYFLQNFLAFFAFPFTAAVVAEHGVIAALVTWVLASISMGVPSNGGIGPWQWATIVGLGIYGVGATEAGAFANVVLGTNTLLLIVLGIYTFAAIALDKKKHKQQ